MLCDVCESIFGRGDDLTPKPGDFDVYEAAHQPTYGSLVTAAQTPCYICRELLICVDEYWPSLATVIGVVEPLLTYDIWRTANNELSIEFKLATAIWENEPFDKRIQSVMSFFLEPVPNDVAADAWLPSLSATTDIVECAEQIRRWLELCTSSHSECNTSTKCDWYPTRLLDLGISAPGSSRTLRLIHTNEHDLSEPYITLSHCWGGAQILKLTLETVKVFSASILFAELPRTFREAIEVAHHLGVRYIWIDSLCIIQDSEDDWLHEAALMSEVYQNSFCNIAATASKHSHGGLFRTRDSSIIRRCAVSYQQTSFELIHAELWEHGLDTAALNKRGWVVQERWLCPRMLHFSHDQIFWECRHLIACEIYPHGPPSTSPIGTVYSNFKKEFPRSMARAYWRTIVHRYSSCALTFDSDKLVALSGLAKVFQATIGDEYVAGMWKTGLVSQLAWTVLGTHEASASSRPISYTAPSWSWASINGCIHYANVGNEHTRLDNFREIAAILHVQTAAKSDATGQIMGGFVKIRGPISFVSIQGSPTMKTPVSPFTLSVSGYPIKRHSIHFDIRPEGTDWVFYCLGLFSHEYRGDHEGVGLLLQKTSKSLNEFTRVGVVEVSGETEVEWFSMPKSTKLLDEGLFDPITGYTVTLV